MAASQRKGQRATPRDKRRRRRRIVATVVVYVFFVIFLSWFFESRLPTTVMFVRHADTMLDADIVDPELSSVGEARARLLADFVSEIDVDASLDAIYASEFRRTQQTAAPLAERLGLGVIISNQYEIEEFMANVLAEHKGQIVLIVSHDDIIPSLVAEIHGHQSIEPIGPDDFDDFFIVTYPNFGKVKTLQLHYGIGWTPPASTLRSQRALN